MAGGLRVKQKLQQKTCFIKFIEIFEVAVLYVPIYLGTKPGYPYNIFRSDISFHSLSAQVYAAPSNSIGAYFIFPLYLKEYLCCINKPCSVFINRLDNRNMPEDDRSVTPVESFCASGVPVARFFCRVLWLADKEYTGNCIHLMSQYENVK